jgi:transposase
MPRTYNPDKKTVKYALNLCRQSETSTQVKKALSVLLNTEAGLDSQTIAHVLQIDKWKVYRHREEVNAETFNKKGPTVSTHGGRRNSLLTEKEEIKFLAKFEKAALAGKMVSLDVMQAALSKAIGRYVSVSTIDKIVRRHGWKKIKPAPESLKSDPLERDEENNSRKIWMPPSGKP